MVHNFSVAIKSNYDDFDGDAISSNVSVDSNGIFETSWNIL